MTARTVLRAAAPPGAGTTPERVQAAHDAEGDSSRTVAGEGDRRRLRVLLVIHVDWRWIRQRPQWLAEELARLPDLDVRVAYLPSWRRRMLAGSRSPVRRVPIPRLPYARFAPVRALNRLLGRAFLGTLGRLWRPDATIASHPVLRELLPGAAGRGLLFYDCMDLAAGFAGSGAERARIVATEDALLHESAAVFVPSEHLARALRARVPAGTPVVLVRNGHAGTFHPVTAPPPAGPLRLGYFGTVSSWLDHDLLERALASDPRLEVHAWGPVEVAPPALDRLVLHGPVAHDRLPGVAAGVHALLLPFVLSDLIVGVDPVKLYEYVQLGRPVLSVYYPELDRFRGLVTFYSSDTEFLAALERLRDDPASMVPDPVLAARFLASSTWTARAALVADQLRRSLGRAA